MTEQVAATRSDGLYERLSYRFYAAQPPISDWLDATGDDRVDNLVCLYWHRLDPFIIADYSHTRRYTIHKMPPVQVVLG